MAGNFDPIGVVREAYNNTSHPKTVTLHRGEMLALLQWQFETHTKINELVRENWILKHGDGPHDVSVLTT